MGKSPMETDVVVVGSGVAGLSAALEAALAGARHCFRKAGGAWRTSTSLKASSRRKCHAKQKYIAYTGDQAFRVYGIQPLAVDAPGRTLINHLPIRSTGCRRWASSSSGDHQHARCSSDVSIGERKRSIGGQALAQRRRMEW